MKHVFAKQSPDVLWRLAPEYDALVMGVDISSFSKAVQRWLLATGLFQTGQERPEIAGVRGAFSEHLARAISSKHPVFLSASGCWDLVSLRHAATQCDGETLARLDAACGRILFNETFAPEVMLRPGAPAADWWFEAPSEYFLPQTFTAVRSVISHRMVRHLGISPTLLDVGILDCRGNRFDHLSDGPPAGTYRIIVRPAKAT